MLSFSLRINFANQKAMIDKDYLQMLGLFERCLIFSVNHMRLLKHIDFGHLAFENTHAELRAQTSMNIPTAAELTHHPLVYINQLATTLLILPHITLAMDIMAAIEEFIGFYYNKRMKNYLAFTIDQHYNLHVQLKQLPLTNHA